MKTRPRHCLTCDRPVLAVRASPNHVLHLLISLVTCGLWLIVWALLDITSGGKAWLCPICGSKTCSRWMGRRRLAAPQPPVPIAHKVMFATVAGLIVAAVALAW